METSYNAHSVVRSTRRSRDCRNTTNIIVVHACNAESDFQLNKHSISTVAIWTHLVYWANKLSAHMPRLQQHKCLCCKICNRVLSTKHGLLKHKCSISHVANAPQVSDLLSKYFADQNLKQQAVEQSMDAKSSKHKEYQQAYKQRQRKTRRFSNH